MKEVCIVGVQNDFFYHTMIKPPTSYDKLSKEFRKRIDFVTRYIHGICWDWGLTDEHDVTTKLKSTLKTADKVYIKGSERVAFLEQLLERPVIDLDIFNYQGKHRIDQDKYLGCAFLHADRYSRLRCAEKKALVYRDFLCLNLEKKKYI